MPQVKYIANCVKTDSIRGVGLTWEPGQVRNVTAEVAERLLAHPDTWARADDAVSEPRVGTEEIGLSIPEKPVEEPLPVIDFHGMDKAALLNFVETKYNERLDKRQSEETIRQKAIAIFSRHEMDNEAL